MATIKWTRGDALGKMLPYRRRKAAMRIPLTLSLTKTATFAVVHFVVAFGVAYLLTGSVPIASAIAALEPAANTVAYFFHERAWARFGSGSQAVGRIRLAMRSK
jgi:uncharacterized membrane protein